MTASIIFTFQIKKTLAFSENSGIGQLVLMAFSLQFLQATPSALGFSST